mmetsp:Transcript_16097/g.51551  ORF Transcript_16097/g.51551 Transcript_16097/m.51551 type:complete len:487 (+) Transcript_16097:316-1776(+)
MEAGFATRWSDASKECCDSYVGKPGGSANPPADSAGAFSSPECHWTSTWSPAGSPENETRLTSGDMEAEGLKMAEEAHSESQAPSGSSIAKKLETAGRATLICLRGETRGDAPAAPSEPSALCSTAPSGNSAGAARRPIRGEAPGAAPGAAPAAPGVNRCCCCASGPPAAAGGEPLSPPPPISSTVERMRGNLGEARATELAPPSAPRSEAATSSGVCIGSLRSTASACICAAAASAPAPAAAHAVPSAAASPCDEGGPPATSSTPISMGSGTPCTACVGAAPTSAPAPAATGAGDSALGRGVTRTKAPKASRAATESSARRPGNASSNGCSCKRPVAEASKAATGPEGATNSAASLKAARTSCASRATARSSFCCRSARPSTSGPPPASSKRSENEMSSAASPCTQSNWLRALTLSCRPAMLVHTAVASRSLRSADPLKDTRAARASLSSPSRAANSPMLRACEAPTASVIAARTSSELAKASSS